MTVLLAVYQARESLSSLEQPKSSLSRLETKPERSVQVIAPHLIVVPACPCELDSARYGEALAGCNVVEVAAPLSVQLPTALANAYVQQMLPLFPPRVDGIRFTLPRALSLVPAKQLNHWSLFCVTPK